MSIDGVLPIQIADSIPKDKAPDNRRLPFLVLVSNAWRVIRGRNVVGNTASMEIEEAKSSIVTMGIVVIGTTSAVIVAANAARKSLLLRNVSANDLYIAPGTATTTTGFLLKSGHSYVDRRTTLGWNGIRTVTSGAVRYLEVS